MDDFPVAFIAHGSPANVIQENRFNQMLRDLSQKFPIPKAILVLSAHWNSDTILISSSEKPKTIHDFYNFPEELYKLNYPCPGAPELAEKIAKHLSLPNSSLMDRGLDHGAWQILYHIYPKANIPVLQLSLNIRLSNEEHFSLGKKLNYLRSEGVLIIGSGSITHNLQELDWENQESPPSPWAFDFHNYIKNAVLSKNPDALIHYDRAGEIALQSLPTDEHFLPLLYIIAMLQKNEPIEILSEDFHHAGISMFSFLGGNHD